MKLLSARSFFTRLFGLLGRPRLDAHTGLYLPGCRSIHTFGMAYTIDVLFVDRYGHVLRRIDALPPWRVAICVRANGVVELPAGYCATNADYAIDVAHAVREATSTIS
ncbi:DUF192 domain-containing protein [Pusillimonas sp. ANT_WB101]|uniref:DUF192 domain-containing protein n=1 Tax=Pusillimonas sp. ANT_WB101 TaxID=2597356 RepID=UPI0011EC8032|nr:DUF192 domain-containing protein [Pusillimonas sp. ANT_WB101]KAA0911679.1 DUF192 domain-containing protein [Pusillimonas sp. ANT_WB101]